MQGFTGSAGVLLHRVVRYSPCFCFYGNWQILQAVSADKVWIFQLDHCILGETTGWQHRAIASIHRLGSVCPNQSLRAAVLSAAGVPSGNLTGKVLFQSIYFISLNAAYFVVVVVAFWVFLLFFFSSQMQRLFFGFSLVCFTYRRLEIGMSGLLQVRYFGNLHGTGMLKPLQRSSHTTKVTNKSVTSLHHICLLFTIMILKCIKSLHSSLGNRHFLRSTSAVKSIEVDCIGTDVASSSFCSHRNKHDTGSLVLKCSIHS